MKKIKLINSITALLIIVLMSAVSCSERNLNELPLATNNSTTPEIFIDGFSAGLDYAAWGKVTNFSLDYNDKYSGTCSMRFEVPDSGDPYGITAGGVFQTSVGRDLSSYNVLTFWAKSSETDTLTSIGFGQSTVNGVNVADYKVTVNNLVLTNTWTKYYIPIPDPSKLTREKGMFWYWVNPGSNGKGFTFWIDEMKYEKSGAIAHETPGSIFSGNDMNLNNVETGDYTIPDLSATFNMPNGINQTVDLSSGYLTLTSSNPYVATTGKPGTYTVINAGSTLITARLGDNYVKGSALINSIGAPVLPTMPAPVPDISTYSQSNVVSIYSDSYTNSTVDSFEPYWTWSGGGYTTNCTFYSINGNKYIRYSNLNDIYNQKQVLVAISFESLPIDVSSMTTLHMDVWIPATSPYSTNKPTISLEDWGGNYGGISSVGATNYPTPLSTNQWVSLELPLSGFTGLKSRSHLVHLILGNFPTVTYIDNIYFHK
jgi:hypothetical protein